MNDPLTGSILVTGGTGRLGRIVVRAGDHLTLDHAVGRMTFAWFLAERFGSGGPVRGPG